MWSLPFLKKGWILSPERLSLARSPNRQPKLLLLDEATSALDAGNSQKKINNLLELKNEIAIVLVTHDPTLVERFDVKYNFSLGSR